MKVQAYRNLRKAGIVYSIKHKGLVIDRRGVVLLKDCKFKHANPNALERMRTGNREVCAWVSGDDAGNRKPRGYKWDRVYCDPKKNDYFTCKGKKIDGAAYVVLNQHGCFAARKA